MLKNIPQNISPDLIKVLMAMGHGDELVIADGNFPRFAHPEIVIDCTGHNIPELLESILTLMPLDPYVENPTVFMEVLPNDPYVPEIWDVYNEIGNKFEEKGLREIKINKFDFYDRAKKAYAVITTSEKALYANLIIKKVLSNICFIT